ncbi:MAG: VCBS repeat-containing protein [Planctomycetaceae bacterium]|nr:VCBS repeat-containing protein [Planctomycetaceae bacterium]
MDPASSFNIIGDANSSGGLVDGKQGNIVGLNGTGVLPIDSILDTDFTYNGGSTGPTHALVPGSPALDSGSLALAVDSNGDPLVYDQRGEGFPRVSGPGVDRGAFELQIGPDTIPNDVGGFNHATKTWHLGISDINDFSDTPGPAWDSAFTWETLTGDVNSDGLMDLIGRQRENGSWHVEINNGDGTFTNTPFGGWARDNVAGWRHVQVADVNGDGNDDVIGLTISGYWWAAVSDGTRFTNQYMGRWSGTAYPQVIVGDYNGDGMDDILGYRPATGQWWAGISTGTRWNTRLVANWNPLVPVSHLNTGDINGDGRPDLIAQAGQGYWYYLSYVSNQAFSTTYAGRTTTDLAANNAPMVDDFNGDGLDDLAIVNSRREVWVKLGTGGMLSATAFWDTAPANRSLVNTGDFNSDGRADLLYFTPNTGGWIALLGSEDHFTPNAFGTWTALPFSGFEDYEVGNFG